MRPTPYVASLRIYEPLSAFEPADRLRWENVDPSNDSKNAEQRDALLRVATLQLPSQRPDGAHILDLDGIRYVAPWSTSVRTWASLNDFKSEIPSTVTPLFVSNSFE